MPLRLVALPPGTSVDRVSRSPLGWAVVTAWLVIAFSVFQVLQLSFGRDQGIYAVVGEGLQRGAVPYRDLWDFKPPGIFAVYGVAMAVFGKSMLAPRIVEGLGMLVVVLICRRLGEYSFRSTTAGLFGAAMACLIHAEFDFWHSGQPETFGAPLVLAGILFTLLVGRTPHRARLLSILAGVAFGLAFLLKPPLGGGALVCAAFLTQARRAEGHSVFRCLVPVVWVGLGGLAPCATTLAWFWMSGGLPDLYWTLAEFTPGYTRLGWHSGSAIGLFYYAVKESLFGFSLLISMLVPVSVVLPRVAVEEKQAVWLVVGVCSIQLAGVAMQGKFFQYHYAATLPLLSVLAGLGLFKLVRQIADLRRSPRVRHLATAGLVASLGLLVWARDPVRDLPLGFWHRAWIRMQHPLAAFSEQERASLDGALYSVADYNLAADRSVADRVRSLTKPHDSVYVWGFEPAIYFMSGRRSASRFIYNVPQRAQWQRERARRVLLQDLSRSQPAMIVVQHADIFPGVTGNQLDSAAELPEFGALSQLLAKDFRFDRRIEDFDLYRRAAR